MLCGDMDMSPELALLCTVLLIYESSIEHVGQDGEQVVHELDVLYVRLRLGEVVLHPDHVGVDSVGIEHRLHGQKIQKLCTE